MTAGAPRRRGFTLIELMITVAVIAILAAVAYPSYVKQVQKSRRAAAKAALLAIGQIAERRFSEQGSYRSLDGKLGDAAGDIFHSTTEGGHYTLTLSAPDARTFTVTAAPAGSQRTDDCGSFTYDQAGTKGVTGAAGVASCW